MPRPKETHTRATALQVHWQLISQPSGASGPLTSSGPLPGEQVCVSESAGPPTLPLRAQAKSPNPSYPRQQMLQKALLTNI